MDITVAEERVFQLLPTLGIDQAREKAWDKKIAVFGAGLTSIFSRPKAEDVQIIYSECRYEPFWHVACHVRYVYDRTRSYNIPVSSPEVQRVTVEGGEHLVTAKPRQFTITGVEHCIEEASTEQVTQYMKAIDYLSIIGATAPMLGLLGTVSGMIKAFQTIGSKGMGKPQELAGNIGEALVTTATGLIIAIPCMLAYYYFRNNFIKSTATLGRNIGALLDTLESGELPMGFESMGGGKAPKSAAK